MIKRVACCSVIMILLFSCLGSLTGCNSNKIIFKDISAGYWHSAFLDSYGNVYTCGMNIYGQLGDGSNHSSSAIVPINFTKAKKVLCGFTHTMALKEDGTVWVWGSNEYGQLGTPGLKETNIPIKLNTLKTIVDIEVGENHCLALDEDGIIWGWGYNIDHQISQDNVTQIETPLKIKGIQANTIVAKYNTSLAILKNGTVSIWGRKPNPVKNGMKNCWDKPFNIAKKSAGISEASIGKHHILFYSSSQGILYQYGSNGNGELGGLETDEKYMYLTPEEMSGLTQIQAGYDVSFLINKDGNVIQSGKNTLKGYSDNNRDISTQLKKIKKISSTFYSNLALTQQGQIYCWGQNEYGQLGTADSPIKDSIIYLKDEKIKIKGTGVDKQTEKFAYQIPKKQWPLNNTENHFDINIKDAWKYTAGSKNVTVGIVDTGIDISHEAIKDSIFNNQTEAYNGTDDDKNLYLDDKKGWDFYNGDNTVEENNELNAHGTIVSGIICSDSAKLTGVAPGVSILPLKINSGGQAYTMDFIESVLYAESMGVKILNCSWVWENIPYKDLLVDFLNKRNILYVFAAKNVFKDQSPSKQSYRELSLIKNAIVVGSMDKNGESPFKIDENCDIIAPGKEILSTTVNNRYAEYEGTSVAAPFVSGTAALLLSIDSSLSPTQMKEILLECAKKNSVKYGLLDAGAVLDSL